ncbi:hypothetical protein CK203_064609 [Vitis vinifera]|uniref:Reverse transcriptase Ty1/copia-type domain-containing protein n=1 Tax=Vitis vinifera TaxID=29760 RepID=A0A438G2Z0_VITVI|nr:hypothetical protein CK203_064609 [Vitis vinifera]
MGKLQIEDRRQQEEVGEDPKKEESPLALPPPQQVQGESSQDLPKDWKFVINHPQDQIIEFSKCMHSEFEMSMMGELNFFLGLQIKQLKEETFINQAKYIRDLLKRFNMEEAKTMKTSMSSSIKLDMDEKGKPVNSTMYKAMIDANFAGCKVERKSTSGTCHFLRHSLVSWHSKKQNSIALFMAEAEYIAAGGRPIRRGWEFKKPPALHLSPFSSIACRPFTYLLPEDHFGQISNRLQAMDLILGLLKGWFNFISVRLGLQGKRPAKPSQPEQTEARRKARYDMTLFSLNEDYQRHKQNWMGWLPVVTIFEPIFPTLVQAFYSRATYELGGPILSTVRGVEIRLSLESICRILDILSVGLRVYEAKAWPTMLGFEPREAVQRLCGLADA